MIKDVDKRKDAHDKNEGNGDGELYVEFKGEENRAMGGTFGGNKCLDVRIRIPGEMLYQDNIK